MRVARQESYGAENLRLRRLAGDPYVYGYAVALKAHSGGVRIVQGQLLAAFRSFGANMQCVFGLEVGDRETDSSDDYGEKKIIDTQVVSPFARPRSLKPATLPSIERKAQTRCKKPSSIQNTFDAAWRPSSA
jgi:hypothetical protein